MPGFGSNVVESPQRKMVLLSVKKTGLGTPVLSGSCANMCTVTDNGVGDYTISFANNPFTQIPEAQVTVTTADMSAQVGTVAINSVQVVTTDLAGAAAEADFHLLVIGSLASTLY